MAAASRGAVTHVLRCSVAASPRPRAALPLGLGPLQDRRRVVWGDARLRAKGVKLTSAEVLRGRGGQRVFLAVHELGKGVRGPRGLDVEHKVGPDRLGAVQDLTT